jgi:membrane protease YdiL (CAAX protease family)
VALLVPFAMKGIKLLLAHALDHTAPLEIGARQFAGNAAITLITGAAGEELGWRRFVLPRLQTRWNHQSEALTRKLRSA